MSIRHNHSRFRMVRIADTLKNLPVSRIIKEFGDTRTDYRTRLHIVSKDAVPGSTVI